MNGFEDAQIRKVSPAAGFLLVALAVFSVFSGALGNGFVEWDDPDFVAANPMIRSLGPKNLWDMATSFHTANWHPLTWMSHAADYRLFGLNPAGHHFTSVVLHGLNAGLAFLLFVELLAKARPEPRSETSAWVGAVFGALWFGVHPLRVESAAWISERKDVLCAFFVISTFLAYVSYVAAADEKARRLRYLAALSLFALALMSKPMAVTVPFALLILDAFPLNRWPERARAYDLVREKLPFFVLSLVCGAVTWVAQRGEGAMVPAERFGAGGRLLNAAGGILFYLEKTLWPKDLSPLYPFSADLSLANVRFLLAVAVFSAAAFFSVWAIARKRPVFPAVWLYYLIAVLPVLGIIQVGRQATADRYAYLSTLSFYALAGGGMSWLWDRCSQAVPANKACRIALLLGGSAVAAWLGCLTVQQIGTWKNSETLWSRVVERFPRRFPIAYYSLGKTYDAKGSLEEAEDHYKTALDLAPDYVEAINGLGLVYYERGLFAAAEREFKRALSIRPDSLVHTNLGMAYFKTGRLEEAQAEYLAALRLRPDNLDARNNLGLLYDAMGRLGEAEREFKNVLRIDFDYAPAHLNLGVLYKKRGQAGAAAAEFKLGGYLRSR